ncbi:MAG: response regulator transcription factor [bacterium]|nr:response regulator transcription factor [bacterium]
MKTILVLEDNEMRIRWLQRLMRRRADVLWTDNVLDFLDTVEIDPDLILMDHDLGQELDGRDAAKALYTSAPIIVWSANTLRGPQMVDILEQRGLDVFPIWLPFGSPGLPLIIQTTLRNRELPQLRGV